jgi:hypothetical protein
LHEAPKTCENQIVVNSADKVNYRAPLEIDVRILAKQPVMCQFGACDTAAVFLFASQDCWQAYCETHGHAVARETGITLPPPLRAARASG